ncbi:MAG: transglycosylase domain-containing protein [Nanoarchaeota archaeon]
MVKVVRNRELVEDDIFTPVERLTVGRAVKKGIKYSAIAAGILSIPAAVIASFGAMNWISTYKELFPDSMFTHSHIESRQYNDNLVLDRSGAELWALTGGAKRHTRRVDVHGKKLEPLLFMLTAREDNWVRNHFDGIQNSGWMGYAESIYETFDVLAKVRAAVQWYRTGDKQGGSGLLCQYAKNLFEGQEHNVWFPRDGTKGKIEKKIVENINGIRLARSYDPSNPGRALEDLVLDYVNMTYASGTGYGIGVFMRHRFNQDVNDVLTKIDLLSPSASQQDIDKVNMIAYYVASLTSPEEYNPFSARYKTYEDRKIVEDKSNKRKDLMIKIMQDKGYIHPDLATRCLQSTLKFERGVFGNPIYDPAIMDIKNEAIEKLSARGISADRLKGMRIHTTLDSEVHDAARYFLQRASTTIDILGNGVRTLDSMTDDRVDFAPFMIYPAKVLNWNNGVIYVDMGKKFPVVALPINDDYKPLSFTSLTQKIKPGDIITVGVRGFEPNGKPILDLVSDETRAYGGVLVSDLSGKVVARAGQIDSPVQLGSVYKILLADFALRVGWNADDILVNDRGTEFKRWSGKLPYKPQNYGGIYSQNPSLRDAFGKSENVAMVYLLYHLADKLDESEISMWANMIGKDKERVNIVGDKLFFTQNDWIPYSGSVVPQLGFERLKRSNYNCSSFFRDMSWNDFQKGLTNRGHVKNVFDELTKIVGEDMTLGQRFEGLFKTSRTKEEEFKDRIGDRLDHFYFEEGRLCYSPDVESGIKLRSKNELRTFLDRNHDWDVMVNGAPLWAYDSCSAELNQLKDGVDEVTLTGLLRHHPVYRAYLGVEMFKFYLGLHGIENIDADLSLPLGTHDTSLVDFNYILRRVLTTPMGREINDVPSAQIVEKITDGDKVLYETDPTVIRIENWDLFSLMLYGRLEGTGKSLESPNVLATKTGTTERTTAITGIVEGSGQQYIVTVFTAGKDEFQNRLITGSRSAGSILDGIAPYFQ